MTSSCRRDIVYYNVSKFLDGGSTSSSQSNMKAESALMMGITPTGNEKIAGKDSDNNNLLRKGQSKSVELDQDVSN